MSTPTGPTGPTVEAWPAPVTEAEHDTFADAVDALADALAAATTRVDAAVARIDAACPALVAGVRGLIDRTEDDVADLRAVLGELRGDVDPRP